MRKEASNILVCTVWTYAVCSCVFTKSDPHSPVSYQWADVRNISKKKCSPPKKWWSAIMGNGRSESSFSQITERTVIFFRWGQQKYLSRHIEPICQIFTQGAQWRGVAGACVCGRGGGGVCVWGRCGINCRHCTLDIYTLIGCYF